MQLDIINIRKLYTEVNIMPKYIKADQFFLSSWCSRSRWLLRALMENLVKLVDQVLKVLKLLTIVVIVLHLVFRITPWFWWCRCYGQ